MRLSPCRSGPHSRGRLIGASWRGSLTVAQTESVICVHAWQRNVPPRLEVFQTAGRGWGVRAAEALPQGTFVCCYLGEVTCDAIRPLRVGLWAALTAGRPHSCGRTNKHTYITAGAQRRGKRAPSGGRRAARRRVLHRDRGAPAAVAADRSIDRSGGQGATAAQAGQRTDH